MKSTVEIMLEHLAMASADDDGAFGDAFEIAVRSYIMHKHVTAVKRQGKTDIRFTWQGKRYYCEIKSACGELDGTDVCDYVIYCPTVDPTYPAEWQGYVLSREQWAEFISSYPGRGKFIRYDSKRGHAHIQSFYVSETVRPKASKPMAAYIQRVLFEMPTVEDFFAQR